MSGILSDRLLKANILNGNINVSPIEAIQIQPASIDLRLGFELGRVERTAGKAPIDPLNPETYATLRYAITSDGVTIYPGESRLGVTYEKVQLGPGFCGQVVGRSYLARLGLIVEMAGFVDPGWSGQLTLEIVNTSAHPIRLRPLMGIAQLVVEKMAGEAERPYGHSGLLSKFEGVGLEGPRASAL